VSSLLERRLAEFVNREDEMRRFDDVIADTDKKIMVVCGDSGLGKSSLLARMTHQCAARGLRKAEVTWTDTRPHDYMAVMRKIRDDLDPPSFAGFTDLINFFTKNNYELTLRIEGPARLNIAEAARISESTVGDVAGVVVKDFMINVPRSDMAVPDAERMARLTDRFIGDLRVFLAREPVVLFLDAVEKMSADTERWLWAELLTSVRDTSLRNLSVILCGQRRPALDRDWELCVEVAEIQPLGHGHIIEYLGKRGVPLDYRAVLATMLLAQTRGKAADIAKAVDAFLKLQAKMTG
jgi:hypothetical protein